MPCRAVRPFITDDARVVGKGAAQLETWLRVDKDGLEHWIVPAVGVLAPLELSLGGVYGYVDGKGTSALPLVQMKALVRSPAPGEGWPGIAIVGGALGPGGGGPLETTSWDTFGYVAFTESFGADDLVLVHQNVGVFVSDVDGDRTGVATWGLGAQVHTIGGLHLLGEIFSGDPYAGKAHGAFQVGVRYLVNDIVQVDATVGHGLWGVQPLLPLWGSLGLRFASEENWL